MIFDNIKRYVIEVLKENEKARDDDFLLCIHVFLKMGFAHRIPLGIVIHYDQVDYFPAFETITRLRREIQNNQGKYKPSSEAQSQRVLHQEIIQQRYGGKAVRPETMKNSWMMP